MLRSHIQYFWEAVQVLSKDERAQLINFCSGRSRLPAAASDFHMSFKLTAPPPRSEKDPDDYLPIARTCFFSLSLPKYTSAQVRFYGQCEVYALTKSTLMAYGQQCDPIVFNDIIFCRFCV